MIIPEYLQKEVKKYCKLKNIFLVRGKIPTNHVSEIQRFISDRLKKDRAVTRRKEEKTKLHIKSTITKIMDFDNSISPIEEYMADALSQTEFYKYCRRQFEIGAKTVDFAFPIAKLVIECDGRAYHFSDTSQIEHDQKRDKYLARKGWRVLHIEGFAIRRNIGLCIEKIKEQLEPFLIT